MLIANIFGSLLGMVFGLTATLNLKPTSLVALLLISLWTAAPFIGTLILTLTHNNQIGTGASIYLSLFVNILVFLDIRYWHPDPQGAIAFLGLPIIAVVIIALTMTVTNKNKHHKSNQAGRS